MNLSLCFSVRHLDLSHTKKGKWSTVRFPLQLAELTLSYTAFAGDLSMLENLKELQMDGVKVEHWEDFKIPPNLKFFHHEKSNFKGTPFDRGGMHF